MEGLLFSHSSTKKLLKQLPNDYRIVLLEHEDLDSLAVDGLIKKEVKVILNKAKSMSGKYEHNQVERLLQAGIEVYDCHANTQQERRALEQLNDVYIEILNNQLYFKQKKVCDLQPYEINKVNVLNEQAKENYSSTFKNFITNSVSYMNKELAHFSQPLGLPNCMKKVEGKPVFIIARNAYYEKDIIAMKKKIKQLNAIIVAVDGAADSLISLDLKPHFIVGDMDSVSNTSLRCGAEIICHRYLTGQSPAIERVNDLGCDKVSEFTFVGTSEDLAIYLTYWSDAKHLYLIGCRIGMSEFLEKGRSGMSSSILSRIQAGNKMTDLKGIHQLYRSYNIQFQLSESFKGVNKTIKFLTTISRQLLLPFKLYDKWKKESL
ncbi:hypothetical protein BTS2_0711 [Bacillus sp. TS-2]|nr:hypothetical protein BTS2_0711 [Bacillus sp. TS-2]